MAGHSQTPPQALVPGRTIQLSVLARSLLDAGISHQLAGRIADAIDAFAGAAEQSALDNDSSTRSEACRRLGILHHLRGEPAAAAALCQQALLMARGAGQDHLAAEALNALAGFDLERGAMGMAEERYQIALQLSAGNSGITARIRQNLGILANIQGGIDVAMEHYLAALAAFEEVGDAAGLARVHHNLGLLNVAHMQWTAADEHFGRALVTAVAIGDRHLQGLCLINQAEMHVAHGRYDVARQHAEEALAIFDGLDARLEQAVAYRVLGMIFRENNRPVLAESRLRSAVEMAVGTSSRLTEAEANRELGRLYERTGRTVDALRQFERAEELFIGIGARTDWEDMVARRGRLALA